MLTIKKLKRIFLKSVFHNCNKFFSKKITGTIISIPYYKGKIK